MEPQAMPKIGIVLSGGMSKVAYEIGCLQALLERFEKEQIVAISASSIGVLAGYACCTGKLSEMTSKWKHINEKQRISSMLRLSRNAEVIDMFLPLIDQNDSFFCNLYATVWNYPRRQVEYISFSDLSLKKRRDYMLASVSIPLINKAICIEKDLYFDGAFLDNIPVYPFLGNEPDYIFCVYFDGWNYQFENQSFDRRIIKLNHFPEKTKMDFMIYDSTKIVQMIDFGYRYTLDIIEKLFASSDKSSIYAAIEKNNRNNKNRITTEVLLTNLNKAMAWFSKRRIL